MSKEWFYSVDGQRVGPVDEADIFERSRRGIIDLGKTLVWTKGMQGWLSLRQCMQEGKIRFSSSSMAGAKEDVPPEYAACRGQETGEARGEKRRVLINYFMLLSVVLFPVVLFLSVHNNGETSGFWTRTHIRWQRRIGFDAMLSLLLVLLIWLGFAYFEPYLDELMLVPFGMAMGGALGLAMIWALMIYIIPAIPLMGYVVRLIIGALDCFLRKEWGRREQYPAGMGYVAMLSLAVAYIFNITILPDLWRSISDAFHPPVSSYVGSNWTSVSFLVTVVVFFMASSLHQFVHEGTVGRHLRFFSRVLMVYLLVFLIIMGVKIAVGTRVIPYYLIMAGFLPEIGLVVCSAWGISMLLAGRELDGSSGDMDGKQRVLVFVVSLLMVILIAGVTVRAHMRHEAYKKEIRTLFSSLSVEAGGKDGSAMPGIVRGDKGPESDLPRTDVEIMAAYKSYDLYPIKEAADQGSRKATENLEKIIQVYTSQGEEGNVVAQKELGHMYKNGWGVDFDYKKSIYWFEKAGEMGDIEGQLLAAGMIELEAATYPVSMAEDDAKMQKAIKWIERAANQGDRTAQKRLAVRLYADGGTPESNIEAYKWYYILMAQNDEDGIWMINRAQGVLDSPGRREVLRQAKIMADQWNPEKEILNLLPAQ